MKKVDYVLLVVLITILSMSCNSKSVKSNDSSDAEQHMVTPDEDLIYKGKYYLRTDKAKKRIEIHYMYSLL